MNELLYFSAQALDNTSPDHYQIGSTILRPEEEARHREIARMVSEVARKGKILWRENGAELIVPRFGVHNGFLIQVYSGELDRAGRRAPILCCGKFNDQVEPAKQIQDAIQAIPAFAEKIGRTVDALHVQAFVSQDFNSKLNSWADRLKKKRQKNQLMICIGIIALVAVLTIAEFRQSKLITLKAQPETKTYTPNSTPQR